MAFLEVRGLSKSFPSPAGVRQVLKDVSSRRRARRVRVDRRHDGQRQVDAAQPAGRSHRARRRHRACIDGEPVTGIRDDAAFVFQNYSLLPWFTALENVRLAVRGGVSGRTRCRAARARHRGARARRARQRDRSPAAAALGRHAAARGDRARVRHRAATCCSSTSRSARSTR